MQISELSKRSGVAVATVKYYLREGLLPEGERVSATRAEYDDAHARRLALIRALIGVGGLSVAGAKAVLEEVDDPPESLHDVIGSAYMRLPGAVPGAGAAPERAADRALLLLRDLGWDAAERECADEVAGLARAIGAIDAAGLAVSRTDLAEYGLAMGEVAWREVRRTPTESIPAAVRYVVLGTVVVEPLLLALRRLAHVEMSRRLLGAPPQ